MLKTICRIGVMYLVSIFLMRIAGKREVAQLEVGELVASFMVSEIACMPLTDPEVPLWDSVVFVAFVILYEILLAAGTLRIPLLKHLAVGKPSFLVVGGVLDKKELKKSGVSLSELVSAMRSEAVTSISQINYAIQEPDGNISIIPFEKEENANEKSGDKGLEHMLICDGKINKTEAEKFGYGEKEIYSLLRERGIESPKSVFFLGIDDVGNVCVIEN